MTYAVCIPTLNAGPQWSDFWAALSAQTRQPQEVLVLDSGSTDATREVAFAFGARVVPIEPDSFRHGGTRQLAATLAGDVDVLLYLTQDAILADRDSVSRLLSRFEDPEVAAAYGRQLPRRGANPIEAHGRLFNYPDASALRSLEDAQAMGFKAIFFSNSFGAYRRSALTEVGGFPEEANFGEDTQVVARLLMSGCKVAYAADATVYHSHPFTVAQEFARYVQVGDLHGSAPWLEERFGSASGEGLRFVRSELSYLVKEAPHLCPKALLRTAMKYMAYWSGRRRAIRRRRGASAADSGWTRHSSSRAGDLPAGSIPSVVQERHD